MHTSYARLSLGLALLLLVAGCAPVLTVPAPEAAAPRAVPPAGLVILQSDESRAYADVTQALIARWKGKVEVHTLNPYLEVDEETQARVQASAKPLVVAVGLPAARHARRLSGKKVVFCQVFNYEDAKLVTPWMKGVSALPPVGEQFRAWKNMSPELSTVSVITGKGLHDLVREASAAAKDQGITLRHIEVNSDLELRYAFQRTSPEIKALWLVPDNRVLSRDVLRDVLTLGQKRKAQVLVFNEQLLPLGGVLSVDSAADDIAEQVLARFARSTGETIPGPAVTPLTKLNVRFNPALIKRLGLRPAPQSTAARHHVS